MLIAKIIQENVTIEIEELMSNFQYSQNLEMQFVRDENYADGILTGWYKKHKEEEKLLDIAEDGVFTLPADIFTKDGSVQFSFAINYTNKVIHLGWVELYVERAFGNTVDILPEEAETWISVVTRVAKNAIVDDVELVKEKAAESSNNAKSALESANLAKTSADNASLSERRVLEYVSTAESFKNDASNYADQAGASASNAAENAKVAEEHLGSINTAINNFNTDYITKKEDIDSAVNSINTTVNNFNTDYTEKINEFNTNYTTKKENFDTAVNNANTALNATITEANTSIANKVVEATEQANRAESEANRAQLATDGKLDKQQGTKNAGKAMVVDEDGNVVPGDALPKNVYTQEEVDYMLADKMDKPYVPIEITDNATIIDALEGNFKIDMIKGNTYQKVETDIVPTPQRPIPINSRKVLANGEYVELRSLKETGNLFDKNIMAFTSGTLNSDGTVGTNASYAVSGFVPVGPSTQYTIKVIDEFRGSTKVYYDINKQLISNEAIATFTTPSNCYFVRWQTATTDTRVLTEEDIQKINDEMMMVKGDSLPSSYVAHTVRDYKIVDHETKTAKIIRNIGVANLTNLTWTYGDRDLNHIRCYAVPPSPLKYVEEYCYCNVFECAYAKYDYSKEAVYLGNNIGDKTISIMANQDVFAGQTQEQFDRLLKEYINNPNAETLYALETPTEEEIAYSADDVSEVGYSWQDTTSPSPTIKSEINGVEEIDILKTGKNLFDVDYVSNHENWTNSNTDGYFYIPIKVPKGKQLCLSNDKTIASGRGYYANFSSYKDKNSENYYFFYHNASGSAYGKFNTLTKDEVIYLRVNSITVNLSLFIEDFKHLQIEVGDTATAYEPYAGQPISITPPQPLYQNDIVNVESGDYEYYTKNTTIDFNRFYGNLDLIQENTVRYYFHKNFVQEFDGIILDTLLFDCFTNVNDDSDIIHFKIGGANNEYIFMYIPRGHIDNKAYAKEYLSSLNLIANFAVENKTTQPIPEDDLAKLKSLKTNVGVNNIFINSEVKPSIEARYPQNVVLAVNRLQTKLLTLQKEVINSV